MIHSSSVSNPGTLTECICQGQMGHCSQILQTLLSITGMMTLQLVPTAVIGLGGLVPLSHGSGNSSMLILSLEEITGSSVNSLTSSLEER